ncbi:sigma-54 interaction domain-containing protein [Undibacterium sp. TJN19]|uniref:sigma-54 interaction domain-containing protein n=1 Tax=Undibacterium sp. TJN19 TaxID=3413055 RepID=UPI003BEFC4F6
MNKLLTFPDNQNMILSIRAKAMMFNDPRSAALLLQVERIARSEATALIISETGTGKELVARHIHNHSGRKGPFIAVNCGAFSETLIDAELFGHESGAFTGATQSRSGWFEAANGGTLFLDEIGDLSLALQVKLLRVLQERQVVRLGSRKPIPLDVRLVAATNVDLHKAIEAEHFRSDLYYRLSVATINLPPLFERTGDILPLAYHFIAIYGEKMKLDNVRLSSEAETALLQYDWPGNIRELENVIHFALIVCRDKVIVAEDLKLAGAARRRGSTISPAVATQTYTPEVQGHAVNMTQAATPEASLKDRLQTLIVESIETGDAGVFEFFEQTLIHTAFNFCAQNQVQTAKLLGISRNILRTHLKHHGLIGFDIEAGQHADVNLPQGMAIQ